MPAAVLVTQAPSVPPLNAPVVDPATAALSVAPAPLAVPMRATAPKPAPVLVPGAQSKVELFAPVQPGAAKPAAGAQMPASVVGQSNQHASQVHPPLIESDIAAVAACLLCVRGGVAHFESTFVQAKHIVAHAYHCRNNNCKVQKCFDTKCKLLQVTLLRF